MINDYILNLFLITVQKEYFNNPIQVGNYPDFASIKNSIEKNFIKIQNKTNNKESNSYSYYLIYLLIAIIVFASIIMLCGFCCKKKRKERKDEKKGLIELSEL